jgi:hypothetical protein
MLTFRLAYPHLGWNSTAESRKTDHTKLARNPALSAPRCRELRACAVMDGRASGEPIHVWVGASQAETASRCYIGETPCGGVRQYYSRRVRTT